MRHTFALGRHITKWREGMERKIQKCLSAHLDGYEWSFQGKSLHYPLREHFVKHRASLESDDKF
jgi:hypothetical protein